MTILPGLIDVHVHLREPGQTDKEDFATGTAAALAGGYTMVVDMPNNAEPVVSVERLDAKIALAGQKAVADIGFHYGSLGNNLDTFAQAAEKSVGLKLYLNRTTGGYLLDPAHLAKIYDAWPSDQVVLLHAEEDMIDMALEPLRKRGRPVHICHVPGRKVLETIIAAKRAGLPVTCGVCPHHLFLDDTDAKRLGPWGRMLPPLKSAADRDYLWSNFDAIDVVESDHAPHTREQKEAGAFGVPGLETTLPLLLTAEHNGDISREQVIDKCHSAPARIFGLATHEATQVEVSLEEYEIAEEHLHTKCGWSPFAGRRVRGRVKRVKLRGDLVFEDGKVISRLGAARVAAAGSGI